MLFTGLRRHKSTQCSTKNDPFLPPASIISHVSSKFEYYNLIKYNIGYMGALNQLYLIRHGEPLHPINSDGQQLTYGPDSPLSDHGILQIASLGNNLRTAGISKIITSPYARALQTAIVLTYGLDHIPIEENPGLQDVAYPGWKGHLMSEVIEIGADLYSQTRWPERQIGQESLSELLTRVSTTVDTILSQEHQGTIALVGHGDSFAALVFHLTHPGEELKSYDQLTKTFYMDKGTACLIKRDEASGTWCEVKRIAHGLRSENREGEFTRGTSRNKES